MKWAYSIKNKLLASVVLLGLCLLVLLSNYLDRVHTKNVTKAIATMYEDRLIAEEHILQMTSNIYMIREFLTSDLDFPSKSSAIGKRVKVFNDSYKAYLKTKLTASEEQTAKELISHVNTFKEKLAHNIKYPFDYTEKALASLNQLSAIQLEESKLIMKKVELEYAAIKASSQFAFAIVIVILVVLQAIVFSSKTMLPIKQAKEPMLN